MGNNRYLENKENKGLLLPTAPSSLTLARAFYLLLINLNSCPPYHVENYTGYETIPQIAPISWKITQVMKLLHKLPEGSLLLAVQIICPEDPKQVGYLCVSQIRQLQYMSRPCLYKKHT